MKIELVEFYEISKSKEKGLRGTVHVFLPELNMDIRGIDVIKLKGKVLVYFPTRKAIDQETKLPVRYPLINFIENAKNQEFRREVRKLVSAYLSKIYDEKKVKKMILPSPNKNKMQDNKKTWSRPMRSTR